jgi:type I restriction enzyme S subunit
VRSQIVARGQGAIRANIGQADLRTVVAVLPSPAEQAAIAAALSDTDTLIAALDRLIAKKRDVKQAAVQQLLTGKRRLSGFSEKWTDRLFGSLAAPRRERVDLSRHAVGPVIELEDVQQVTGRLIGGRTPGVGASLKSVFEPGDVLFGKLRAYLRKYWLADRFGACSTEFWVLRADKRFVTPEFLFQLVQTDKFIEAASTAYGTHMPRSDWAVVRRYEVPTPPVCEQAAIANLLTDMDAEIGALEARREKTRLLKQGMMQELLTGRIRLV